MGDRAEYRDWFFVSSPHDEESDSEETEAHYWPTELIEEYMSHPSTCGQYNLPHCNIMLRKHRRLILGKRGIVLGTIVPWAEGALLNMGAREVITIEYNPIIVSYPRLLTRHPSDVARSYLDEDWEEVDFAFTFSSLEHDGLGRYGDPLDPFGDLESLARIRCLLKPGGFLFLAVPTAPDAMVWNAHRLYGKYRIALMLLGWIPLDIFPESCDVKTESAQGYHECQPIFLLQKTF